MTVVLGALLIFSLRIVDVSIGTLRTLYMVRGDRLRAVPLAFCESLVWVIAASQVMSKLGDPYHMVAYAAGFATGTFTGITIERWIASGWILARIVGCGDDNSLVRAVRDAGFGVTVMRGQELLDLISRVDPDAFVTVDPVQPAMGGFLPQSPGASGVRK